MNEKKRFVFLMGIMIAVALLVTGTSVWVLYRAAIQEETRRLTEVVHSQAYLIESVAAFGPKHSEDFPGGVGAATLSTIFGAMSQYGWSADTGEFTVARRDGDTILYLFVSNPRRRRDVPEHVPFGSPLAVAMQQALSGKSGTTIAKDYLGNTVLAAYEPVGGLGLGIVGKIDMVEVRSPFVRAILISMIPALLIIVVGAGIFSRTTEPVLSRMKQNEASLRQAEQRFQQVARNAKEWIWEVDPNGLYTYASPVVEKVLGYVPREIVGRMHFFDFFHADDRETLKRAALELFGRKEPFRDFVNRNIRKDGRTVWLSTSGIPRLDENGKLIGYLGLDSDITRLKHAEEERVVLERQLGGVQREESLGRLAGGIAHDFNNLLMGVLGNADLALLEMPPESPLFPYLTGIKKTAVRLADLTRQMLAYSGKGKFVVSPIDLSGLVEEMTHLLEVSISKKVVLKYELMPDIPPVMADATQLRQVVMNLVINAVEAIGQKSGIVSLRTGFVAADRKYLSELGEDSDLPEGYYVFLEISDTGNGMDKETMNQIFDPFFSTKFTGRGLGLSAVRGIVRGHCGAIKVYSEPRRGSTFKILLPKAETAESLPQISKTSKFAILKGRTALVVDDEETVCAMAKLMLERAEMEVLTARNGREALEVVKGRMSEGLSIVLLDLSMPHMDGIETFKALRSLRPDLPVVLCSGYNEQDATGHFAGKGLAGFIQKPFELATLIEKIAETLGKAS